MRARSLKPLAIAALAMVATRPAAAGLVAPEPIHRVGTVRQGAVLSERFVVRNEGAAPLRIARIELGEPGMRVRFRRDIPPGAEGTVTLEWDTRASDGDTRAEAAIILADGGKPAAILAIEATVVPRLAIEPLPAAFLSLYRGECASTSLTIRNNDKKSLAVTVVEPAGRHFDVRLTTLEPGRTYELRVDAADGLKPGRYREALELMTDDPERPRVKVPVNILVKDELYVTEEGIDFGRVRLADLAQDAGLIDLLTQTFLVKRRDLPFRVVDLWWDLPELEVTREPEGPSSTFRFDVRLRPQALRPGLLSGELVIVTDDPEFPQIVVPVRGVLE